MRASLLLLPLTILGLAGCDHGNIHPASSYTAPKAPLVRNPVYDPYAPYAQANATWRPSLFDRDRTIVKPVEPSSQDNRPDYEHAPWATGGSGNPNAGTF